MAELKMGSLNARGLNTPYKRKALFKEAKAQHWQVIFFQETHLLPRDEPLLKSGAYGAVWFNAEGSHKRAGVAIMVHKDVPFQVGVCVKEQRVAYYLFGGPYWVQR